jgi:hypothetical protein
MLAKTFGTKQILYVHRSWSFSSFFCFNIEMIKSRFINHFSRWSRLRVHWRGRTLKIKFWSLCSMQMYLKFMNFSNISATFRWFHCCSSKLKLSRLRAHHAIILVSFYFTAESTRFYFISGDAFTLLDVKLWAISLQRPNLFTSFDILCKQRLFAFHFEIFPVLQEI